MPLRTDWQGDAATTPTKRNDELAKNLRALWNGKDVKLALRTPADDDVLTKPVIDGIVANTAPGAGEKNAPDPRNDGEGWRIYFP